MSVGKKKKDSLQIVIGKTNRFQKIDPNLYTKSADESQSNKSVANY